MSEIKSLSLYLFEKEKKILLHGMSITTNGPSIASEPYYWFEAAISKENLVENILSALTSLSNKPIKVSDWSEYTMGFLRRIGFEKKSELYKKSKYLGIIESDGILSFLPSENLGSKGFIDISKEKTSIAANSSFESIANTLDIALKKCK
jgi:hypothetical protein